jgi:hypothetical protein
MAMAEGLLQGRESLLASTEFSGSEAQAGVSTVLTLACEARAWRKWEVEITHYRSSTRHLQRVAAAPKLGNSHFLGKTTYSIVTILLVSILCKPSNIREVSYDTSRVQLSSIGSTTSNASLQLTSPASFLPRELLDQKTYVMFNRGAVPRPIFVSRPSPCSRFRFRSHLPLQRACVPRSILPTLCPPTQGLN